MRFVCALFTLLPCEEACVLRKPVALGRACVQVREECINSFEANKVIYTSDVVKVTVLRAENLPQKVRARRLIFETEYDDIVQSSEKRKCSSNGIVECVCPLSLSVLTRVSVWAQFWGLSTLLGMNHVMMHAA